MRTPDGAEPGSSFASSSESGTDFGAEFEPETSARPEGGAPSKLPPEAVQLRARPRTVRRLNRRVLAAGSGALAAAVLGGTLWSLQAPRRAQGGGTELHNVDRVTRADGLERLPRDYAEIAAPPAPVAVAPPVLGEPLPGDLGHAMAKAQPSPSLHGGAPGDGAAQAARLAAEEAARSSVFFRRSGEAPAQAARASTPGAFGAAGARAPMDSPHPLDPHSVSIRSTAPPGRGAGSEDPVEVQSRQGQKERFAASETSGQDAQRTRNVATLELPQSPYQVMAGAVIPAALATGINSDLPGQVIATVTQGVYDTATGRHLLIPQGARLIGRYDSQVSFGQRRVLLVWTRLVLPDASSISLDRLPGIDPAGYAGLEDGVDWHWDRILSAAALSTLLGVGAELAAPQNRIQQGDDRVVIALRDGVQSSINEVGQDLTRRNMSVQPTLTVRPGSAVNVMVNKDLILRPYQPLFFSRTSP